MDGEPTGIRIIRAREQCLDAINGLIARSKAYWSWPKGYLEQALPFHRVSPAYVRSNPCFEVLDAHDKLIAFVSLVVSDARVILDNLWITPTDRQWHRPTGMRACLSVRARKGVDGAVGAP